MKPAHLKFIKFPKIKIRALDILRGVSNSIIFDREKPPIPVVEIQRSPRNASSVRELCLHTNKCDRILLSLC